LIKNSKEVTIEDKYLENLSYIKLEYNDNSLFNDIKEILNEEEYDLIFNHIVMGYSLVELAKELNLSKNTIKSKYRRALLKLKLELRREYYE
jgi:DNA-directed RNA polymerase specialized sigma24 family protein